MFEVSCPKIVPLAKETESFVRGGVFVARGVLPSKDNCMVLFAASVCLLRIKISLFASVKLSLTICIAEIFFKALEVSNTSVDATEYPPIDEKFFVGIVFYYLEVIYTLTLVVVNLPVKFDDEAAAGIDLDIDIITLLPTRLIVAFTRSLSEVIELVTVQ